MDLPKVIIRERYGDFLEGKEVEATVITKAPLKKGMHVMGYHDSIGVNTAVTVPKDKQSHYIGVEGVVTATPAILPPDGRESRIKIVKC